MKYKCPVCGFGELREPPLDFNICPSCGTEFGYDNFTTSFQELRERWIAQGAPWFSTATARPPGWNPSRQLYNAGFALQAIPEDEPSFERVFVAFGPPVYALPRTE